MWLCVFYVLLHLVSYARIGSDMDGLIDPGKRGNVYHCGDGYSYHSNRYEVNDFVKTRFLRCSLYATAAACRGRAAITEFNDGSIEWVNTQAHTCFPDLHKHSERLLRNDILNACRTERYMQPRQLLNLHAARFNVQAAARLRNCNLRSAMHRARSHRYPPAPASMRRLGRLLEQPQYQNLQLTEDGTDTIYSATVGPEGDRSAVFISQRMMTYMGKVKEVFVDGTFVPTPLRPAGRQVYQIVTLVNFNVIPLGVAIMESKSYVAYRCLLQHIRDSIPRFRPRVVHLDFEEPQQRAWREVFNCVARGCYIHYIRSVMRKVRKLGLTALLRGDIIAKRIIRSILAIPLLPHNLMARGLFVCIRLALQHGVAEELCEFFVYFITTWMMGFRYETLSVYNELHRTNNASEAANRVLRLETGSYRPSIWNFLNALKRYEHAGYIDAVAAGGGGRIGRNRKVATLRNDHVIRNLTAQLMAGTMSIKTFLRRASARTTMVFQVVVG